VKTVIGFCQIRESLTDSSTFKPVMGDSQLGEGTRFKMAVQADNTDYDDSLLPGITQRRRDHRVRFCSPDSRINAKWEINLFQSKS
jgi:hypothetical protein